LVGMVVAESWCTGWCACLIHRSSEQLLCVQKGMQLVQTFDLPTSQ
jgi:hypothetical protein